MNSDSGTGQLFHPFHPGIHIHITPESISTSLRNDYSHAPDSAVSNLWPPASILGTFSPCV
ncbi:MAG: hypothetical protein ABJF23_34425, partial [Bryobacteraceae bacterium]